ncbi:unnamed protein product [Lymnaea stagnalis]|uniref:Uncharacterized protein n=1 Tax=Lymnaea stagnalis TaxID=6523 RepID=A0AAV2HFH0_LYMST
MLGKRHPDTTMSYLTFLACVCLAVVSVTAAVDKTCTDNSQCDAGECCQILSEFMIVSKRATSGTCQKYALESEPCGLYDRINGYCSCTPGTTCTAEEVLIPTTPGLQKRKPVPPRPGYMYNINCVKN